MDFAFSEEQTTVRELAREILAKEVSPERLKAAEASADWTDAELWSRLAEANLLGLAVPEALGGMGMGFAELCVLLEEIGRQVAPLPAYATLVLGALPLTAFGTEAQRKDWLPRVASGEVVLSAALDAVATAALDGRNFRIDGSAEAVPFAGSADRVLLPASLDGTTTLFWVEPGAAGVTATRRTTSTGEPLFDLALSGVSVEAEALLGGEVADGAAIRDWLRERALVALCALQVGVSGSALEITTGYVREREQFGVPIGSFQAVQHRCADAFIDLETMRWTLWRAAWRLDQGLPASREVAVAKFWTAEGGSRIANAALHLHGGLGSDIDYPIHRHFLWSKALELSLGSATPQLVWLGRDMARTGPQESG